MNSIEKKKKKFYYIKQKKNANLPRKQKNLIKKF